MKKHFITALLAGALSLTATSALAYDLAPSQESVQQFIDGALKHATEALGHAQQGHAPETATAARAASAQADEAVSEMSGMEIEQAQNRLNTAIVAADKGDAAGAVAPLQEAVAKLTAVKNAL